MSHRMIQIILWIPDLFFPLIVGAELHFWMISSILFVMRYRPEHKIQIHQKIVKDASRRVRTEGLNGAAVGAVMRDTGLTHGGFYKHFGSKDDLLVESLSGHSGKSFKPWFVPLNGRPVGRRGRQL